LQGQKGIASSPRFIGLAAMTGPALSEMTEWGLRADTSGASLQVTGHILPVATIASRQRLAAPARARVRLSPRISVVRPFRVVRRLRKHRAEVSHLSRISLKIRGTKGVISPAFITPLAPLTLRGRNAISAFYFCLPLRVRGIKGGYFLSLRNLLPISSSMSDKSRGSSDLGEAST